METWSNICFGYLLESLYWGDSNKCPKHMFYEEIWMKQCLSYISLCPLKILCNSEFVLMATFLETNRFNEGSLYLNLDWRFDAVKIIFSIQSPPPAVYTTDSS